MLLDGYARKGEANLRFEELELACALQALSVSSSST